MKLRNILSVILSAAAIFSACTKEEATDSLKSIQVSKTYLAIAPAGGSVSIDVTSNVNWNITTELPDWLKASATSGTTGKSTLTFSAEACGYGRQAEIQIAAGVHTQFLTVRQGEMTVETVKCKDVLAGVDGKTYRITGTCTAIANTTYGNWYINDGTGEVYVYGTVNSSGSYSWSSFNIEVGDVVTIEGPKTTYGTTIELVDATFISVTKSLLKLSTDAVTVPSAGGEFTVKAAYKGNGAFVNIPDEYSEWISVKKMDYIAGVATKINKAPADTAVITFCAASNSEGPRNASVEISTKTSSNNSAISLAVTQLGLSGTEKVPFTVAEAIQFCSTLSGATADNYYVKGIVTKVLYSYSADYGTATFWISDDGTDSVTANMKGTDDKSHDFECYSVYWFGNKKWSADEAQIEAGDEVVICGQLTKYNGIAETNSKKAWVYALNGVTVAGQGAGTEAYPFTVAGAINATNSGYMNFANDYCVSGIVTKVLYTFSASYGTGTFWISDDGTDFVASNKKSTTDKTHDFECYNVYWLDNQKWVDGDPQVASGDKVTIKGQLTVYQGTSETNSKKAWILNHTPAN